MKENKVLNKVANNLLELYHNSPRFAGSELEETYKNSVKDAMLAVLSMKDWSEEKSNV